jgi:hypothetical protein
MLQGCGRDELDYALEGVLGGHEHIYCGVVEEARRFGGGPEADWGVAIAWREGALRDCAQTNIHIHGAKGALPVAILQAFVVAWGEMAMFVCTHLDLEGCPRSVTRSNRQAREICIQVRSMAAKASPPIKVRCAQLTIVRVSSPYDW